MTIVKVSKEYMAVHPSKRRGYYDLTLAEKQRLSDLNKALAAIENKFLPIAIQRCTQLKARLATQEDWIQDFEAELNVTLFLDESEWQEDEENDVLTLSTHLKHIEAEPSFGFGALHYNHAEIPFRDKEFHCWLYHCTYDHSGLTWNDIVRISPTQIWIDLVITEQILPSN